ncbi:MAG: hypothetical protein LAT65_07575 [Saccharospirillum sp.]|nr:hypothetical protein [Saccharospirillum sp.]
MQKARFILSSGEEAPWPRWPIKLLSYYRGLTHDQLADVLSTPAGTVKSWIRRGLKSLKRCLEQ